MVADEPRDDEASGLQVVAGRCEVGSFWLSGALRPAANVLGDPCPINSPNCNDATAVWASSGPVLAAPLGQTAGAT